MSVIIEQKRLYQGEQVYGTSFTCSGDDVVMCRKKMITIQIDGTDCVVSSTLSTYKDVVDGVAKWSVHPDGVIAAGAMDSIINVVTALKFSTAGSNVLVVSSEVA